MRITLLFSACLVAAAVVFVPARLPAGETIGFGLGPAFTTSRLKESFGSALGIEVNFSETLRGPLHLGFALGTFYMGETSRDELTRSIFGPGQYHARMNIIFLTVSPGITVRVLPKISPRISLGVGLYSVSLLLSSGFFSASNAKYHLGVTSRLGMSYPLFRRFNLTLDFSIHKFWTGRDQDDMFFLYSQGDEDPNFYYLALGAELALP